MNRRALLTLALLLKLPIAFVLWALIGFGLPFAVAWLYWSGNLNHIWNDL